MCEVNNIADHVDELKTQKEELEKEEKELDEQTQRLQLCLKNITEDTYNDQYPPQNVPTAPRGLCVCSVTGVYSTKGV